MTKRRLTDADIFALPDGAHGFNGPQLDVRGDDRRWSCKVYLHKVRFTVQLGTAAELPTAALATKAMIRARKMAKDGIDPRETVRLERGTVPTFGVQAEAFMADYVPTLKNVKQRAKWFSSVRNHCKPIWSIKVDALTTSHMLLVLKPIWTKIPTMAAEVRSRMEMIIDDATFREHRKGENPARWTLQMQRSLGGRPPRSGKTRGSQRAVHVDQVGSLMADLAARNTQTARAIYVLTLTCLRGVEEFLPMHTRELQLDGAQAYWTVPYGRLKVDPHGHDFRVPLPAQAVRMLRVQLDYLESITGQVPYQGYLWPAINSGERELMGSGTMLAYLQNTLNLPATVHGQRAVFKTWARGQFLEGTEATPKYHHDAIEYCLAHTTPGGRASSEDPYSRDEMMLKARAVILRDWADFCAPVAVRGGLRAVA
ncbi:MAG TPA: hypothetical protein VHT00_14030 [Stellaceae bacterium]|jgi:hypothetical protein|nr:hypothetical protein [Stellaceae bacterium]